MYMMQVIHFPMCDISHNHNSKGVVLSHVNNIFDCGYSFALTECRFSTITNFKFCCDFVKRIASTPQWMTYINNSPSFETHLTHTDLSAKDGGNGRLSSHLLLFFRSVWLPRKRMKRDSFFSVDFHFKLELTNRKIHIWTEADSSISSTLSTDSHSVSS